MLGKEFLLMRNYLEICHLASLEGEALSDIVGRLRERRSMLKRTGVSCRARAQDVEVLRLQAAIKATK